MDSPQMEFGEPDESGRRRPIPILNSNFVVYADTVILAIGEKPDTEWLEGFEKTKQETIVVDENYMTSIDGIFAGGDAVLGPKTIIEAVATARKAAEGILKIPQLNFLCHHVEQNKRRVFLEMKDISYLKFYQM